MPIVAKLLDPYKVVINQGSHAGVRLGARYLVYAEGDEVWDPVTKQSLGRVELIRGEGKVVHIQESMATLESTEEDVDRIRMRPGASSFAALFSPDSVQEKYAQAPFRDPHVGDFCRPI